MFVVMQDILIELIYITRKKHKLCESEVIVRSYPMIRLQLRVINN